MKKSLFRLLLLTGMAVILSACFAPTTPQEVTQAFWKAVINGDARSAAEYSTLADPDNFDGFSRDWRGFQPSWGKVIIEGDAASVVSKLASPANSGVDDRKFVTHLVRRNEQWTVDYERTGVEVRGGALMNLFGTLSELGGDFSRQLRSSANDFNAQMEHMSRELEGISEEFGQQASDSIERYAEELRKSINELEESINRALKEDNNRLSDKDRRVLKEVSAELDENGDSLSEPNVESISRSSRKIGDARLKLESLESDSLDRYRGQWQDLSAQFEEDVRKMLEELSASAEGYSKQH